MDEPTLFLKPWQVRRYRQLHEELLRRADVVVTSSRILLERYRVRACRTALVTNGVRHQLLAELLLAAPSPALAGLPRPRLGYVGMMSHWFDFDAVKTLARSFPRGSVLLVGPVEGSVPRLPGNVVFVGPVPHLAL